MKGENLPGAIGRAADAEALLRFARDMWRYKWVVPLTVVLAVTATYAWLERQPRIYRATCLVEYLPRPAQPLQGAVYDTAASGSNWWATREFYETQNRLLGSRSVAERVVRDLSLQTDPDFLGIPEGERVGFEGVSVATAAGTLRSRLSISQLRDTSLVHVSFEDTSPRRAKEVANAVAESYMERSIDDRTESNTRALEWLGSQLGDLKEDLANAELSLHEFRKKNRSLSASLEERQNLIAGKLSQYTEALTSTRTKKVATEARLAVLRRAATESPDAASGGRLAAESGTLATLRENYIQRHGELEALLAKYGTAHPTVATVSAQLESLESQYRQEVESLVRRVEDELQELQLTEKGLLDNLEEVNQEGLELNLREMEYTKLDRERQQRAELYGIVMERAAQADLTRAFHSAHGRIVDEALVPAVPVSPNVHVSLAVGLFAGLFGGLLLAALLARLDNKVSSAADVEDAGVTVMGVVPRIGGAATTNVGMLRRRGRRATTPERDMIVHNQPRSSVAESCRNIRTNLAFQAADRALQTLAITSAGPSEGKTTVSVSLATAFAQNGQRVLLVDSDLRRPRLHKALGLASLHGLTSVLAREKPLEDAVMETEVPGLSLLPCGPLPPNPAELLHTKRFADLVTDLKKKFDLIVFDTPPLGAVTDPSIISKLVEGTLLVVKARQTTRPALMAALRTIRDVELPLIGAVLNDVDVARSGYAGGYYYYQYYGSDDVPTSPPPTEPARP